MNKRILFVLVAGLFAALPPSHSQPSRSVPDPAGFRGAVERLESARSPFLSPKQDGCVEHFISCGQTAVSDITFNDCATDSNIFFDVWFFQAVAGQTITATMSSSAFDPFLLLFDPDVNSVAEDDDSGPGDSARITFDIDQTSPDWTLTPTPLEPFVTGPYTLSLQCSNQPPPPPPGSGCPSGFFSDSEYPDFCFRVTITPAGQSSIPGTQEASCQEDTVCVSGAVPGRSETFIRILGPRPNGFLWPTIVRFTPSAVVVDLHQLSSGDTNTYTLPAVPPGADDLSGLQDRMGFSP